MVSHHPNQEEFSSTKYWVDGRPSTPPPSPPEGRKLKRNQSATFRTDESPNTRFPAQRSVSDNTSTSGSPAKDLRTLAALTGVQLDDSPSSLRRSASSATVKTFRRLRRAQTSSDIFKWDFGSLRGDSLTLSVEKFDRQLSLSTLSLSTMSSEGRAQRRAEVKLPPWDRCIDVEIFGSTEKNRGTVARAHRAENRFTQSVRKYLLMSNHPNGSNARASYFTFPESIRFRIAKFVIEGQDGGRPIILNIKGVQRPVWFYDSFTSWATVLDSLEGALNSSFGMRADIMIAIFTTFRFHAIFSPYVREQLNPLATKFLKKYVALMQRVTLEIDLTKLSGGPTREAVKLRSGREKTQKLMDSVVEGMKLREGLPTMENLTIVCRRFHGDRPESHWQDPKTKIPYVPEEALSVANGVRQLSNLIGSMRIVGFSERWTADTMEGISRLASTKENEHIKRRCPSDLYPLIKGQSSYLNFGPEEGGTRLLEHIDDETNSLEQLTANKASMESDQTVMSPVSDVSSTKKDRRRWGRFFG